MSARIFEDRVARLTADILRGKQPADILVEAPRRSYLTINSKTADAIGLIVPP
jgi:hypothetical protein